MAAGWLLIYLGAVNLLSFAMMGWDKSRARRHVRRVPEKRLFGLAAAGGAVGIWAGMRVYRHKTKHRSFRLGVPALFLLNAAVLYFIVRAAV